MAQWISHCSGIELFNPVEYPIILPDRFLYLMPTLIDIFSYWDLRRVLHTLRLLLGDSDGHGVLMVPKGGVVGAPRPVHGQP